MPDTGIPEALSNAGLSFGDPLVAPGHRVMPIPQSAPVPELIQAADCVCYVEKQPDTVTLDVTCQSACQRVGEPQKVDLDLLLEGSGTFDWDDTNSGFSIDGGTTYNAILPDTGDAQQDPLTGVVVSQERQYRMVLDMSEHLDNFLTVDEFCFLVSFTTS